MRHNAANEIAYMRSSTANKVKNATDSMQAACIEENVYNADNKR